MDPNHKKLLIVDDERQVCENLSEFLTRRGYNVSIAIGGAEALSVLKDNFFPVILLDIKMPGVDGMAVLRYAAERHPTSKIIMVTGFDEEGRKQQCLSQGAYDYIVKPIRIGEFFKRLEELFSKA